jgi:hypothetical protein
VNVEDLNVEQGEITLNYGTGDTSAAANGSGIRIQDAVNATTDATILWDAAGDKFDFSHGATFGAKVQAASWFQGNSATNLLWSSSSLGVYLQTPGLTANNNNSKIFFRNSGGTVKHTFDTNSGDATFVGSITVNSNGLLSTASTTSATTTTTIASLAVATYTAGFFDYSIKNGTNVRAGTVVATHDGTNVEFNETSTVDLGDTSDVTLSVDISSGDMRLRATTTSSTWTIKALIRGI